MLLRPSLELGWTKAARAKYFGVNCHTVDQQVETGQLDRNVEAAGVRYRPRLPVPTKLDPFRESI